MSDTPPHRTLRRIFEVVMEEAKANPQLAQKLARAIGQEPAGKQRAKPARRSFDASQLHAINILRLHGESALRGKLEEVKAIADLRSVARASGLVLSGNALKGHPTRADLIAAIIAAAKHYDAQRSAATA